MNRQENGGSEIYRQHLNPLLETHDAPATHRIGDTHAERGPLTSLNCQVEQFSCGSGHKGFGVKEAGRWETREEAVLGAMGREL